MITEKAKVDVSEKLDDPRDNKKIVYPIYSFWLEKVLVRVYIKS